MPGNLDAEKTHSYLWKKKALRYSFTNFCPSLHESETNRQIGAAFSVWQSVSGLSFRKVSV